MNRPTPSGSRSRIAPAVAVGALVAISTLSAPAHALAAPTPLHALADSAMDPTKLAYQTNGTNVPTSFDGLRYAQLPLPIDHRGGSNDDDDDDVEEDSYYNNI